MDALAKKQSWTVDQLAKSGFFHHKLHEWGLLETARAIDTLKGETFTWERAQLGIATLAWDKIIHRGIKPVLVFAHPQTLESVPHSVGYYRMLAMVSQKSMSQVGLPTKRLEEGGTPRIGETQAIVCHLNRIISALIEADASIDAREFDLWRGMAAGAQAQGSWQNVKGRQMEFVIHEVIRRRLRESGLHTSSGDEVSRIELNDGRIVVFGSEPDVAFYAHDAICAAVEIKGGIDKAGVLERVGAALKSLGRVKGENSKASTILILADTSLTPQALRDLDRHHQIIDRWFVAEAILTAAEVRDELFTLLGI